MSGHLISAVDASYTLSSPLHLPSNNSSFSFSDVAIEYFKYCFSTTNTSLQLDEHFSDRIACILDQISSLSACSSSSLKTTMKVHVLVNKIKEATNPILLSSTTIQKLEADKLHSLYQLALKLRTLHSFQDQLWTELPAKQQQLFNSLINWNESLPTNDKRPLKKQKLSTITPLNLPTEEVRADFGDGHFFVVKNPVEKQENWLFELSDFPAYVLSKPKSKFSSEFSYLQLSEGKKSGRMGEVFDIDQMTQKINNKEPECVQHQHKNQLLQAFKCYKSSLYNAANLPAHMPLAISKTGDWSIFSKVQSEMLSPTLVNDQVLSDIHRHFHIEKLWNINVLEGFPHNTRFSVFEGRAFLDNAQPLPTFFDSSVNLVQRHKDFMVRLEAVILRKPDFVEKWSKLEAESAAEFEEQKLFFRQLLDCYEKNYFSLENAITCDDQMLVQLEMLKLTAKINEVEEINLLELAEMARLLMTEKPTNHLAIHGYTVREEFVGPREVLDSFVSRQLARKEKFMQILLAHLYRKVEGYSLGQKFQKFHELGAMTLQALQDYMKATIPEEYKPEDGCKDIGEYFMLAIGDEVLEKIEQILQNPSKASFDTKLSLLKFASENGGKKEKIDEALLSVLHEEMVEKQSKLFVANVSKELEALASR